MGQKRTYNLPYLLIAVSAAILFIGSSALAQQQDFRGIVGFGLEKKISPSFSATLYNENQFSQNLAELGSTFIDAGINYRLSRNFSFGADYRFNQVLNLDNKYVTKQMIYGDVIASKNFHRLSVSLRARFQNSYAPLVLNDTKTTSIAYNRDRLTLRYRCNYYFAPFVYGELWYPFNHPTHEYIDRVKGAAGFYYTFNDHFKTELYYSITQELNQQNKKTNYTLAVVCYYRI